MEFIRKRKVLLAILSFLLIWLPQYVDTIWSLLERIQQVNEIPFNINWLYIITAPIGLTMLGIIVWQSLKGKTDKPSPLHTIVPTLEKMDTLLTEISERESKRKFSISQYSRLNERINSEVFGVTTGKATTLRGVKRSMSKFESQIIKKYGQSTAESLLPIMTEISGFLDRSGFGLKKYKERGRYRKLMRELTKLRNDITDEEINALIKKHIVTSETLANMLLVAKRGESIKAKHDDKTYTAMDFVSIPIASGISQVETSIREYMIEIRVKIGNRINKLETNK